ncbi:tyrosine-type recombinase/integrase [Yersinia enterocolitica]|uniref:phage integrase n=1 Tax=Yersinia enterocolitica TaxID=630 RepID=UPI0005E95B69|nr:tyrosine-type recombinase/integrase [Yersinia enterocolitica]EKN6209000.1 integrase [Yersinia enterocolitica]UYJ78500.1 tyrosine-type recombinase/integrase [Yersinia enterocolitica]CNE95577.1 P2-like phage integrase [Yersinia enterocolitica]HEN3488502.1 tyrosine-type recombinase/integrase [Yersinia enterocolitica]
MSIKSLGAEGYMVDVRPQGREGKRVRRKFKTKAEAQQYERWVIATQNNKDWVDKPADQRPLLDLIELWWKYHGQNMKDGVKRAHKLRVMAAKMGHPKASQITRIFFSDYRALRLAEGKKAKTVNLDQEMLGGVFSVLIELGHYHSEHPLKAMKKIKLPAQEMGFLTNDEIRTLLSRLEGDHLKAVKLCLATGARWGEVAKLRRDEIIGNKVTYLDTKNSKNRTVPISHELCEQLTDGVKTGPLFKSLNYPYVRTCVKEVAPGLPAGQAVHVLRHTFASHFMMNGGNILALQKILGHSNILQTMTYAHFAPDYLQDAVRFNPLTASFFI